MRALIQKKTQPQAFSAGSQRAGVSSSGVSQGANSRPESPTEALGLADGQNGHQRNLATGMQSDFSLVPAHRWPFPALPAPLRVNTPGDSFEQEADRVADQAMSGPVHSGFGPTPLPIQRYTARPSGQAETSSASVHRALASPGRLLEPAIRQEMEQRFSQDFSRVRVHTGVDADLSADELNAQAYTVGNDVVFGAGRYAPGSQKGQRLLAHELTHVVQQGPQGSTIQRALKFEIQTRNYVWAVKNRGDPDPTRLPRKYAPTTRGYGKYAGEERGDRPAYLAVGHKGGPARKKRDVVFVEAEGPRITEEAKSGVDPKKGAQFIRIYQFTRQVKIGNILDKPVAPGQLNLISEIDNSELPAKSGDFNPNTFEFKYLNANGRQLEVHLNKKGVFKSGHVRLMKVGREKPKGIDDDKEAQYVEIWKVTDVASGGVDFLGQKRVKLERVGFVDNSKDSEMEGKYNPGTWEKNYYKASDITGNKPSPKAKPLDVHLNEEGRIRSGSVKFMLREKLKESKEQTAIEVQSETDGVLEFETPKWFREWPELKERLQEAVDITKAINDQRGTPREVTDPEILDAIDKRKKSPQLGEVVEWPAAYSTAHLTNLRKDKRRLLIQIVDDKWLAKIQASEGIRLSEYESLLREHERPSNVNIVLEHAKNLFNRAFSAAKKKNSTLNESRFANLKGFLQLIVNYIVRGQVVNLTGKVNKAAFLLLSRTNFGSLYQELLSSEEKALFKSLIPGHKKSSAHPILDELQRPVNDLRAKGTLKPISLNRDRKFFFKFKDPATKQKEVTFGPAVGRWLENIPKGKDLLTGKGISDALGARSVETTPGEKDFEHAQFEVRGTVAHGGNNKTADKWVSYAEVIFDEALKRSADTPDDPRTPKVNESSKTGLKK
jgi:hypothetical protein